MSDASERSIRRSTTTDDEEQRWSSNVVHGTASPATWY